MIDGTVARKTGTANDFGSKFDSIADFIFWEPKIKTTRIFRQKRRNMMYKEVKNE